MTAARYNAETRTWRWPEPTFREQWVAARVSMGRNANPTFNAKHPRATDGRFGSVARVAGQQRRRADETTHEFRERVRAKAKEHGASEEEAHRVAGLRAELAPAYDPSKHPRGPDGRFLSKAQVEAAKGKPKPKPVTRPTRKTPVRPKPVEIPAVETPAPVFRVKAYAGATDAAVEVHAWVLDLAARGEALHRSYLATDRALQAAEYRTDILLAESVGPNPPRGTKAEYARAAKASDAIRKQRAALGMAGATFDGYRNAKGDAHAAMLFERPSTVAVVPGRDTDDPLSIPAVRDGLAFARGMFGEGSPLDGVSLKWFVMPDVKRAFARKIDGAVLGDAGIDSRTVVHEIGHHVEFNDPAALRAAVAFREKRRADSGESYRSLGEMATERTGVESAYDDGEVGFGDHFRDPYVGKRYADDYATEILSMGLDHMWTDPVGFARSDPEYFQMVLTVVQGTRRKL